MKKKRNYAAEILQAWDQASLLERRRFILRILRTGSAEERHLVLAAAELVPEDMPAHEVSAMVDDLIAKGLFGDN